MPLKHAMKTIAYIAASLDGYIADPEGSVDWLNAIPNPEQSDYGFADFLSGIDAVLMGRKTFEVVQSFGEWPYSKPVYVISTQLTDIPQGYEGRVQLVSGPLQQILERIEKETGPSIYVDGGTLIRSCLAKKCLSTLILTTVPILLGQGIPLFASSDQRISLTHRETEVLGAGLVKSTYTVFPSSTPEMP